VTVPKVKVNDIQVYYEVHGAGFPLVMIHGLGANLDWWEPRMVQEFSKRFTTVTFDNRGAGRTDVSNRNYTIRLFADDTAGLMDALGISRAHVLGLSMGGRIAQELVLDYPQKVEKLVLCSASCGGKESAPLSEEMRRMLAVDRSASARASVTEDFVKSNPGIVEAGRGRVLKAPISDEAYRRQLNASLESHTYDRLSQIRARTLILHGSKDVLSPPENGRILAEAIPGAKLVYLERSGHALLEEMDEVINLVTGFLG
jgi:pimeloyl-ACP methyl ester carboxylesterase